jgi:AcrR family transcriptional regulator
MPVVSEGGRLERMRDALTARVEATSLRQVAREVGMSPTGLQKVLDGADSYSRTRRKLELWYIREKAQDSGTLSAEPVLAALRVLAQDLPTARRRELLSRMLEGIEDVYVDAAIDRPDWIREVKEMLALD